MRTLIALLVIAVAAFASPALAQSPWSGVWKIDQSTLQTIRRRVFLLSRGLYTCPSCVPRMRLKADGQFHGVPGSPYFDATAIQVINDKSVRETDQKAGKTVMIFTMTVSADGKKAVIAGNDIADTNGVANAFSVELKRLAPGVAGAHAISGTWADVHDQSSDSLMQETIDQVGDTVTVSSPTGQGYTARIDGPDAPYRHDPGISTVSLRRAGPSTIVETDKFGGKLIYQTRLTLSADGKTLHVIGFDPQRNITTTGTANRQ